MYFILLTDVFLEVFYTSWIHKIHGFTRTTRY